ncbi:MAG TPA: hypothetical protein VFZ21_27205, partial [Gemmatimonadaceae bacterium]|nr:hypothetical protein [Gemmatimonadaceae bacterium]
MASYSNRNSRRSVRWSLSRWPLGRHVGGLASSLMMVAVLVACEVVESDKNPGAQDTSAPRVAGRIVPESARGTVLPDSSLATPAL